MSSSPFVQNIVALQSELKSSLLERNEEVDCVLLALLSGQHCLLVGPPGTAKSALCNGLRDGLRCKEFKRLLTKFTTPDEIFGPYDLNRLAPVSGAPSVYERLISGYLPDAEVAFLDEIWKASSAILNALLEVMNERTFTNGNVQHKTGLRTIVAASNEYPLGEGQQELGAAFDRFLIRKEVRPVSVANQDALCWGILPPVKAVATIQDIDAGRAHAKTLPIDQTAKDAYTEIRAELRVAQVHPGDRRLRLSVDVCRAAAVLDGSPVVLAKHLECLQYILWDDPANIARVKQIILGVVNPGALKVDLLLAQAQEAIDTMPKGDKNKAVEVLNKLKEILKDLGQLSHIPTAGDATKLVGAWQTQLTKAAFGL